jgi:sec-independent protein translocase protein TatB
MFDIGWTEMLVLGIVTLLVVGPRELPSMLRTAGRYAGRMRDMAAQFRGQMSEISDELDARQELKKLTELAEHPFKADVGTPDLFTEKEEEPSEPSEPGDARG